MMIGELEVKTGVPASTIRFWERIGVLPKPARVNGQRRYGAEAVHRLAMRRLAQACGFTLDEMRYLLNGFRPSVPPSRRWQQVAGKKKIELDEQMAQLRAMRKWWTMFCNANVQTYPTAAVLPLLL